MIKKDKTENNFNKGHRKRLREKFLKTPTALYDYELLEMILFSTHSRKDTKSLAKKLLNKFGSFKNLVNSNVYDLQKFSELNEAGVSAIKLIKEASNRLLQKEIEKTILLKNTDKVCEYCRAKIGHLKTEQLRILYINSQYKLIADETLSEGNMNETPIYKNMIVTKATLYGASSVILTHNHPSGDPHPSEQDLIITNNLSKILFELGIELLDHIIVTNNDSYSMKATQKMGQAPEFTKNSMSKKEAQKFVKKKFKELTKKTS
jgi:DNA repair protein RadC